MKTKASYYVIDTMGRQPRVVRVTSSWPSLRAGEVIVRFALEIPDSVMPRVQEIVLEDTDAIGLAVAPTPLEV